MSSEEMLAKMAIDNFLNERGSRNVDVFTAMPAIVAAIRTAVSEEREACAQIALAIDSNRGNEKEIALAIRKRK